MRQPKTSDDIFTIKQLASYLQLNERTVYRLAADGQLPAFKVGGSWRFRRADIDSWIDRQAHRTETDLSSNDSRPANKPSHSDIAGSQREPR